MAINMRVNAFLLFVVFTFYVDSLYFKRNIEHQHDIDVRPLKYTGTRTNVEKKFPLQEYYLSICSSPSQCLSYDGYKELGDVSLRCPRLTKGSTFLKKSLNKKLIIISLLHYTSIIFISMAENGLLVFYFLIISGVEQNPGPVNNTKAKRRVRKSGLQYKKYLTNQSSFDNAPSELRTAVSEANVPEPSTSSHVDIIAEQTMETSDDDMQIIDNAHLANCEAEISMSEDNEADLFPSDDSNSETSEESDNNELDSDSEPEEFNTTDHADINEEIDKSPIYEGAQLTLGESVLLLMTFAMTHSLTGEAFSELIELVQLHCKEDNLIPESSFKLKKWFQELKINPKKHYYCSDCLVSINEDTLTCPNRKCANTFISKHDRCFFVEVSLIEQIKKLFSQEEFRELLIDPFNRPLAEDTIRDIFDGTFYKDLISRKKLSKNDITFTWNTDGVPLFKSSKTSMWPLFLAVNELPFKIRRKPENLLLVGLWIGSKKPEMLTFLKPFIDDLQTLENGIDVDIGPAATVLMHGFLISGTADLPAKCTVHNMIQFNGKYSCPTCLQPGETAKSGKGIAHIYPFKYDGPTNPKRTHIESLQQAEVAVNTGKMEMGIKGPCWFTQLCVYDFVQSNCIDYMHCVLLGVTKRMISLWFSKEHSNKPYSCFHQVDTVNRRLSKLRPPLFVKRAPRSLSDLKYWKASEYRSFLLFYGPVILMDILSASHYSHFLLFSESIYTFLQESITVQDIHTAENMIELFVSTFSGLYEPRFMTLNLHLLLHLPDNVRQFGPIWGYSCFPFEDANGFLLKLVKGTQSVHSQLLDSISIVHGLPYLEKQCIQPLSSAEQLLHRMKRSSSKNITKLSEHTYALGKVIEIDLEKISHDCYIALANLFNIPPSGTIFKFKRIKVNGNIFHCREYTRVSVRNSYTLCYADNCGTESCYGLINYFLVYKSDQNNTKHNVAIVTKLREHNDITKQFPFDPVIEEYQMKHFKIFETPDYNSQSTAVLVQNITQMCVYMVSGNAVYICRPPNSVEME